MHASNTSSGGWAVVATVEVEEDAPLVLRLPKETTGFRMMQRAASPNGYAWIDVLVDISSGMTHAAEVAREVLAELSGSGLDGFRIVTGGHFLAVATRA